MLFAAIVLAMLALFVAVSFQIQLSMMRLRAIYWESLVKQNSEIRHQWLQKDEPSWRQLNNSQSHSAYLHSANPKDLTSQRECSPAKIGGVNDESFARMHDSSTPGLDATLY
jgi:hypothetical protein